LQVVGKIENHLDGMLGQLVVIVAVYVQMAYIERASMTVLGGILRRPLLAESGPQRRIERDLKKIGGR